VAGIGCLGGFPGIRAQGSGDHQQIEKATPRPPIAGAEGLGSCPLGASRAGVERIEEMAEEFTCNPGDFVVYPTHGVGKVVSIETQKISGHKLQLYVISFARDRMTLRVPVAKAESAGLRKLSTRRVMDNALITLRGRARTKRSMWSRRAQEYEAKINSGNPIFIAEVVRDLHRSADQPDQSFSERQIYEAARDRLACELAAVEKIDITAATEKLEELLTVA
jgi:CarD family transcriptional regulator